jgi:pyruvate,orthophosphate dikinase
MTCGFSREDAASFLGHYVNDTDKQFYYYDPFATIDVDASATDERLLSSEGR